MRSHSKRELASKSGGKVEALDDLTILSQLTYAHRLAVRRLIAEDMRRGATKVRLVRADGTCEADEDRKKLVDMVAKAEGDLRFFHARTLIEELPEPPKRLGPEFEGLEQAAKWAEGQPPDDHPGMAWQWKCGCGHVFEIPDPKASVPCPKCGDLTQPEAS